MPANETIRVRIAPSPTGKLHIGTARTALFNYLFARRSEGKFIVRVEDTDGERSTDEYARDILDGLLWLGLEWDEGPEVGGPFGPYYQKERLGLYQPFIDQLLEKKKAYRCFCTTEEIEAERASQQAQKAAPKYSGKCRNLTPQQIAAFDAAGRKSVIRFIVENKKVELEDLVRGTVTFDANLIGDFVIQRSDGMPLFIFSNAVDDNLMEITHVLRGEDHLSNTAKQFLLAEALNFMPPQFGHFPLIFNANRTKMSKRKDPVSISDDFKAKGYLPEALINFVALLGWSAGDDREIYPIHDLIESFQIDRVGKSPSIFDPEKLLWMNGYYIRHLEVGDLASRAQNFITNKEIFKATLDNPDFYLQVTALVQDRMKLLADIEPMIEFFYILPDYPAELLISKKSDHDRTIKALELAVATLQKLESLTFDEMDVAFRQAAQDNELEAGELLWAVRVALSGSAASPGVFELLEVFGREESVRRLKLAQEKL